MLPCQLRQKLCFRPGDQDVAVHGKIQPAKIDQAEDLLKRFTSTASLDESTKLVDLRLRKHPIKTQVETHAFHLEDVGKEQLRLEPWRIDVFTAQKISAALN